MASRSVVILILALAACASPATRTSGESNVASFPESWLGRWRGEVYVHGPSGPQVAFTKELEITRTDDPSRFKWTILYDGDAGRQIRPYELVVRDPERGHFAIDEKNGIVLEASFLGGALYSWFTVGRSRLLVREELHYAGTADEAMSFEIISGPSRGKTTGTDRTPVESFLATSVQRATLRRIE